MLTDDKYPIIDKEYFFKKGDIVPQWIFKSKNLIQKPNTFNTDVLLIPREDKVLIYCDLKGNEQYIFNVHHSKQVGNRIKIINHDKQKPLT